MTTTTNNYAAAASAHELCQLTPTSPIERATWRTEMWKEVTKDQFFVSIGRKDVHPCPVGRWPYTSEWRLRDRRVIGLTVDYLPEGEALTKTRYMLPDEAGGAK